MAPAGFSWLDLVLVVMLVVCVAFGTHQGLLRQLVLMAAIYVGTALAAQYYGYLGDKILVAFPSSGTEMAHLVAFLIQAAAFSLLVTWLVWSAYRQTRLPTVVMLDQFGGAVVGGLMGVFFINLTVLLARYALAVPWAEGSPIKALLHVGLLNSSIQMALSSPMPLIQAAIRIWVPSGIPLILGS